ncbi:MAG: hypothetical protein CL858_28080 [Cupriavidus sp.]|jgi:hypothetical protein|nr:MULTISPECIES: hypothetical protein [Methylobacterium]MBU69247.1 hypothetical protein [Cupriavidus sp.]MDE4910324.1 hypothetical protein [Methylobacterium sp. 092160098-2]MDH3028424.1 hypothetical protein [Methylobacterium fujisawaense]
MDNSAFNHRYRKVAMMKNVPEIRELTDEEIDCVAGGVSDDALYGAAIGLAVASVGALIAVPTMGTSTTLCVWGASLASSALAYNIAAQ